MATPQEQNTTASPPLHPWSVDGEPVPGYRLVAVLGSGGMGQVWEARGPGGVPIALKRVPMSEHCGQRELEGLKLLMQVRHPHLLAIHGYWVVGADLIIGLELAEQSLRALLQKQQQTGAAGLPREQVLPYLEDAAEALDYLGRPVHRLNSHMVRIQHRDVKPANLLLQGGAVKVADFGLAKALEGVAAERSFSMTLAYAPPEFFQGRTTPTSDQYSLGVTYYELRTGRLPFTGTPEAVMQGHLSGEPDLTGLTERERAVVTRALAKQPELRWAGCVKFIGEIARAEQAAAGLVFHSPGGTGSPEPRGPVPAAETTPPPTTFRGQPVTTGLLLAVDDLVPIPLKRTDVRAAVTAACADVIVTQVFVNTHQKALEATYVFPLPEDAAVHGLRMFVGERLIEGAVHEKEEARATYEEAKREGHGAALVEQTSPNIFTTAVANLLPGQEIRVEIRYLQPLPFQEGRYRFVFPMVVSPRYVLGSDPAAEPLDTEVPAAIAAPRLPQGFLRGDAVSLEVDLDAGVPLCGFDSPSHDLVVLEESGASRVRVAFRRSDEIPNRDFVLNYRVAGPRLEHALLHESGRPDQPGTFLLVATPPLQQLGPALAREIVFVIDRSGSMSGEPLAQAVQAARQLLDRLEPDDAFNVIAFDTQVTPLAATPLPAEEAHLRRARAFLDQLRAQGGTEMLEPLRLALLTPPGGGRERSRLVVFLTDGSVTGERELLAALRPAIGRTRIVAFGIGTAVNRHLVNKLTSAARGFAEYLFPGENIARAVDRTLRRLGRPVLTDVELHWDGGAVEEVLPERCPDVYLDQPLVVLGRFRGAAPPGVTVRGRLGGQPYEGKLDAQQVRRHESGVPLAALWARQCIEELMDRIWEQPQREAELRRQVIDLAKRYSLASQFTSFLAIEYRTRAEREQARGSVAVAIPQYMPQGMASSPPPAAPAASSRHHMLGRVRRPRCEVTYDVETGGAMRAIEMPFVIGVLADLTGHADKRPLKDRKFIPMDRDNFDNVMAKIEPRLSLRVRNRLTGDDAKFGVELAFKHVDDFEPARIAEQIPPLKELLDMRRLLTQLLNKMGDDGFRGKVAQIMTNADQRKVLAENLGVAPSGQEFFLQLLQQAVIQWAVKPGLVAGGELEKQIQNWCAEIDKKLYVQLNEVMQDLAFQQLEASWRGLHYLVHKPESDEGLKIKVFNVSKQELFMDQAAEFDTSTIFHKVYTEEFTMLGGEPYGALIGDYEFSNDPGDVELLARMAQIGAEAFCPFIAAAAPKLLGLDSWAGLACRKELATTFDGAEYTRWCSFRESAESRFVVLTLPRVLARPPHDATTGATAHVFCWMNAAYVLGTRLIDAHAKHGSCLTIQGVQGGGKAEGLATHGAIDDDGAPAPQCPTDIGVTEARDRELRKLGLLPLCHPKGANFAVFLGAETAHKPPESVAPEAAAGMAAAAQLPCVLQTSRFAHYLKIMARDRLWGFMGVKDCEAWLNQWIRNYVIANPQDADPLTRVKTPLGEARIQVQEISGKPGWCVIIAWLRPLLPSGDAPLVHMVITVPRKV